MSVAEPLRTISPTDVSQFIRLDQCQRYLKLSLMRRGDDGNFLREHGVNPQAIPPLLTESGSSFERVVEQAVAQAQSGELTMYKFDDAYRQKHGQRNSNADVVRIAEELAPGHTSVIFQARLEAPVGTWLMRGDMDILRLHRDPEGILRALIVDMKSTARAKVEHRLQVAFYHEMLSALFTGAGIASAPFELGILYRGPADPESTLTADEQETLERQRDDAAATFAVPNACLERITDPAPYLSAVETLVAGEQSTANRVLATRLEEVPFHLTFKCDGCLYNEFCMKWSADHDDLSLLPTVSDHDKQALRSAGITSIAALARLKELEGEQLRPAPGTEALVERLATTWPIGPRIDELVHRARRYRNEKGDPITFREKIPHRGYTSLPDSSAERHPNLIRIYIDCQIDHLNDRVYVLGALVTGCERGEEPPHRRRTVTAISDGPPDTAAKEETLFVDWVSRVLRAIVDVAAPDSEGTPTAPIHLVFFNGHTQRILLDGLARHAAKILGATAIYDFVTQIAGMSSPVVSYLDREIQLQKNYPLTSPSLQSVSTFLGFKWGMYREWFRAHVFDYVGKRDEADLEPGMSVWFTSRARYSSSIPLEYAYWAWNAVPEGASEQAFRPYRDATVERLTGFVARRLEAIERIARDFKGNEKTTLASFVLPDLAEFEQRSRTLAEALDEFMVIERHVALAEWRRLRFASPEDRMLAGETFVVRYVEDDQLPGVAAQNREHHAKIALGQQIRDQFFAANPHRKQIRYTPEQKARMAWSHTGITYRLRIETADSGGDLDEVLRLSSLKPGQRVVLARRRATWEPRPGEIEEFTPTAGNLFRSPRLNLVAVKVERDPRGKAIRAFAEVTVVENQGGNDKRGFTRRGDNAEPFEADCLYTLDSDPNDGNGANIIKVVEGLVAGGAHRLYDLFTQPEPAPPVWSSEAESAQRCFLDGLLALHTVGAYYGLEASKQEYIGRAGGESMVLVQGPPGTGKSESSAFAILARMQAAIVSGREFRVIIASRTHSAIDVLLRNLANARLELLRWEQAHPDIFAAHFDRRLLEIELLRLAPKSDPYPGVVALKRTYNDPTAAKPADHVLSSSWCVVGGTPSACYHLVNDYAGTALFDTKFIDLVVMDEASQMNLPEAMASCLPLRETGQVIVVGDHRQMAPIVKNNWEDEPRRTFKEFKAYASLFEGMRELRPREIKFEQSFRLHRDMAEFLRQEIYRKDGIHFRSERTRTLPARQYDDDFLAAALDPAYPLTVIVHAEAGSMKRNEYEERLIAPIVQELHERHGLRADKGFGVVVPHTLQKAGLQEGIRYLTERDPATGETIATAVDTVERYQGDEREVILISATESNREYVLAAGKFLLDPRRFNVALSRAKQKLILVASRSVFEVFSADDEVFEYAQLWKNLLRRTCTVRLWSGERDGEHVEVWGNRAPVDS